MEGHIMPRGKRNKKSLPAVNKLQSKVEGVVPGYGGHVNGLVIKQEVIKTEPLSNGEHAYSENEQSLQRAIDELINGNDDPRSEYLGDSSFSTHGPAASSQTSNTSAPTSGPGEAAYRGVNGTSLVGVRKAETEPFPSYLPASSCDDQRPTSSPTSHFSSDPPSAYGAAPPGGSGGGMAADGDGQDLLADLQGERLVNGGAGLGSLQRGAGVPGGGGTAGVGALDRARDMPAHWQLTPVGRGRVAATTVPEAPRDARLSPAPPERIQTGFNERPAGDGRVHQEDTDDEKVPQALLNGDKNPVSALNEYGQKRGMEVRIEVVSQSGPPHNPSFCMAAFVGGRQFPVVESSNKKDGRREAAEAALRVLANNGNGWTKNNWPTTAQTEDPAQAGHEVPVRTVTVPLVQETKPAKSSAGLSWQGKNPVSALYEYGQARGQHVCIEVIEQSGPPHNPRFLMAAFMGSHQFPPVEATNKKDGRTEAAVAALRSLSQGGDAVVLAAGATVVGGGGGDAVSTTQASPLAVEKTNGEAVPQVALPMEDEVAAQSKNPISVLNEYGQTKGVTVKFDVLNQSGPPHNPSVCAPPLCEVAASPRGTKPAGSDARHLADTGSPDPGGPDVTPPEKSPVSMLNDYARMKKEMMNFRVLNFLGAPHKLR